MIARLLNRDEVEQAIREDGAEIAKHLTGTYGNLGGTARSMCIFIVAHDGEISGGRPAGQLPGLEVSRLSCVWLIAYATEMEMHLGELQDAEIDRRAALLRCQKCGEPDGHENHFRPRPTDYRIHLFVCTHGQEVAMAKDCIVDHPDVPAADAAKGAA